MEPNYNTSRMSELRAIAKDRGLGGYSRLRKAGLISFLRFDPEESVNEDKVDPPSNELYPKIMEERAQKRFNPEESDNKE